MNPEAQEVLKSILSKDPAELSESERGFLRARRDYLTTEQKRIFAEVLGEEEVRVVTPEEQVVVEETIPTTDAEVVADPNPEVVPEVVPVGDPGEDNGSADPDYKPQV